MEAPCNGHVVSVTIAFKLGTSQSVGRDLFFYFVKREFIGMDALSNIYMLVGIFGVVISLFGYSHANLSKRLDKLAIELQDRKTDADIRILISDKMEPYKVELKSLSKQLDIISRQYAELDKKLDTVLAHIRSNVV